MSEENTQETIYEFNGARINSELDPETVREVWSDVYPAIRNADYETDPETGIVHFRVRGGTKG